MNAKHTPGSWHVGEGNPTIVYDAAGWAVGNAHVFHGRHAPGEAEANALVMAAAPDLLEALESAIAYAEDGTSLSDRELNEMRAAVRKARGQS